MSKPIIDVGIETLDKKQNKVRAVFDSGSFYTIIREDKVPSITTSVQSAPREFRTASQEGKLRITAAIYLIITIGNKMIEDTAFVSSDLAQEMLIGARTMQGWDISIRNKNSTTEIIVGLDMRDPDINEID